MDRNGTSDCHDKMRKREGDANGFSELHASFSSEIDDECTKPYSCSKKCKCADSRCRHSSSDIGDISNQTDKNGCTVTETSQIRPSQSHEECSAVTFLGRSPQFAYYSKNELYQSGQGERLDLNSQRYEDQVERGIHIEPSNSNCVTTTLYSRRRLSFVDNKHPSYSNSEDDRLLVVHGSKHQEHGPFSSTRISESINVRNEEICNAHGVSKSQIVEGNETIILQDKKEDKFEIMKEDGDVEKCKFEIVGISGTCKITGRSSLTSSLLDQASSRNLPDQNVDSSDEMEQICKHVLTKMSVESPVMVCEEKESRGTHSGIDIADDRDSPYIFSTEAIEALCIDDSRYKFAFCSDQSATATDAESSQDRDQEPDLHDSKSKEPNQVSSTELPSTAETNGTVVMKSNVTINHSVPITSYSGSIDGMNVNGDVDDEILANNNITNKLYSNTNGEATFFGESYAVQRAVNQSYQLQGQSTNELQLAFPETSCDPVKGGSFAVDLHGHESPEHEPPFLPHLPHEEFLSVQRQEVRHSNAMVDSLDSEINIDPTSWTQDYAKDSMMDLDSVYSIEEGPAASDDICITPLSISSNCLSYESRSLDTPNMNSNTLRMLENSNKKAALSLPDCQNAVTKTHRRKGKRPKRRKIAKKTSDSSSAIVCRSTEVRKSSKKSDDDMSCRGETRFNSKNNAKTKNRMLDRHRARSPTSTKTKTTKLFHKIKAGECVNSESAATRSSLESPNKTLSSNSSRRKIFDQTDRTGNFRRSSYLPNDTSRFVAGFRPVSRGESFKSTRPSECTESNSNKNIDSQIPGANLSKRNQNSLQEHGVQRINNTTQRNNLSCTKLMKTSKNQLSVGSYDSFAVKLAGTARSYTVKKAKPIGAIEALGVSLQRQSKHAMRLRNKNSKFMRAPVSKDMIESQVVKFRKSTKTLRSSTSFPAREKTYVALHKVPACENCTFESME